MYAERNGLKIENLKNQFVISDVDKLLGDPIHKKIEADSGLKTTLESILTICSGM